MSMMGPKELMVATRSLANLQFCVDLGDYQSVYENLLSKSNLSISEKKLFAIATAYQKNQSDALFYLLQNNIQCANTEFEIYFLNADYKECKTRLNADISGYLKLNYFLAINDYTNAKDSIKGLEASAKWYYSIARVYGHQSKYSLAIDALKKSIQLYEKPEELVFKLQSLANLGTYLNLNNQIEEASIVFSRVSNLLTHPELKISAFLKARFMMNLGHFFLERGKFFRALLLLTKANRFLNKNTEGNEYVRSSLLLANCYLELAHYKEVISILKPIKPIKAYQVTDKSRYIALAYLRMGNLESSKAYFKEVELNYKSALKMHLDYVPIDLCELNFALGNRLEAQDQIKAHCALLHGKNEVALWYTLNRWNYLSNSCEQIEFSTNFHKDSDLKIELIRDSLMSIKKAIVNKQEHQMEYFFEEISKMELPQQIRLELELLKSIPTGFIPSIKFRNNLIRCSDIAIKYKYLAVDLYLTGKNSFLQNRSLWEELNGTLGHSQLKKLIFSYLESLNIQLKFHFDSNETNGLDIFIDHSKQEVFFDGRLVVQSEKKPKLFELLVYLSRNELVSKEQIARDFLGRPTYNPETDDNNIYVYLNRVNKALGSKSQIKINKGICAIPYSVIRQS